MSMSHGGEVSHIIYLDLPLPEVLPPLLLSAVDSKQVTVTSQMLPSVNQLVSAYRCMIIYLNQASTINP